MERHQLLQAGVMHARCLADLTEWIATSEDTRIAEVSSIAEREERLEHLITENFCHVLLYKLTVLHNRHGLQCTQACFVS